MAGSKKLVAGGSVALLAVLLAAVLAAANYISARHLWKRVDLTRNREFTVAPATRKILAGLDDVVNVQVYFSKNLPGQVASIPAKTRDLLTELAAHGRGRLRIEHIDPQASPEAEQKARALGIPRVPVMVLEKNKQQSVEVYLGMVLTYADQKEVIPAVLDNANLEYEVASRILKMTRPKQTVGFLGSHGAREAFGDYAGIAQELRERYQVESVPLDGDKMVPDKVTTLIVAGPKKRLGEHATYAIDQFLMRGGRAFFLVDSVDVDLSSLMLRPVDHGLAGLLKGYGAAVQPNLVEDWGMNEVVQVPGSGPGGAQMAYIVPYPLWPKLVAENISETHPTVSQLPSLVLPFTTPVEPARDADDGFEVTELFRSSPYARVEAQLFSADPRMLSEPKREELKAFPLALAISGPQKSAFAGKPAPPPDPPEEGAAPVPAAAAGAETARKDAVEATQIVVVGGSELASSNILRQRAFAANAVFFLNVVDWLTMGDELIGIRSRLAGEPTLDPRKREVGEAVAPWINIVAVPALVIAFGLIWRAARRRRRIVLA